MSNLLCVHQRGCAYTAELYPLYPNVRNVLNVAVVRVHVYSDNVPGNKIVFPNVVNVAVVRVHVYPRNVPGNI